MSYLIALDDGHGANTPGKRTPSIPGMGVIKENEFNKAVVYYLDIELRRCGFRTMFTAPGDADPSLTTRCNRANSAGANLFVSCHYNAGGGSGVETFYYSGLSASSSAAKAAKAVQGELLHSNILKQKNRGVKKANFAVLRQTKMPAILIEYGFMDDPGYHEAKLMRNKAWQKERAIQTAKGICKYFGVRYVGDISEQPKPKPEKPKPPMRRVLVDGEAVLDSSYTHKLLGAVEKAIESGAKETIVKIRD